MSYADDQQNRAVRRLFGWLLIAIGGLIATLCGLCTLAFVFIGVASSAQSSGGGAGLVGLALIVGGIPIALGVGLIFLGRWLLRSGRAVNQVAPFS
jgi:hypothetical protein